MDPRVAALMALTTGAADIPPVGTYDDMKEVWLTKYRELQLTLHHRVIEHGSNVSTPPTFDDWHLTGLRPVTSDFEKYIKPYLQEQFDSPGKLERWEKNFQFREIMPIDLGTGQCVMLPFPKAFSLQGCTMTDGAKIRFSCNTCAHNWTSMKGRITFWCVFSEKKVDLDYTVVTPLGTQAAMLFKSGANVFFKLYGQDCSQCNAKQIEPKWYQEEIKKVLENFFVQIYDVFYKGHFVWEGKFNHERRVGNPKQPHPSGSCDACRRGICSQSQSR